MKNKLVKILGVISILFILLFPYKNTLAINYSYSFYKIDLDKIAPFAHGYYYLNNGAYMHFDDTFTIHQVAYDNSEYYHGYCLHAGKQITSAFPLDYHKDFSDLKNSAGKNLTDKQKNLLKNIIASGYLNNSGNAANVVGSILTSPAYKNEQYKTSNCKSSSVCQKIIATQILIWETMEGNRTGYELDDVTYGTSKGINDFVKKNTAIKNYYTQILNNAKKLTGQGETAPAFSSTSPYRLHWIPGKNSASEGYYAYSTWNSNSKIYQEVKLDIGSYNPVKKEVGNITISDKDSNNKITIRSSKALSEDTSLAFSYRQGSTKNEFEWFHFDTDISGYQDILKGIGGASFERNLSVQTETALLHLRKYDYNTKSYLKNAQFKLYYCGYSQTFCDETKQDPIATIDITKDDNTVRINKSGYYMLVETKTPEGYEPMQNVYAKLRITDNKDYPVIIEDVNKYHNSYDCIKIGKTADGLSGYIALYNRERTYTIKKIDGNTNKPVNGATFQIKNSKDNIIKFNKKSSGNFEYNENGNLDSLYEKDMNVYTFSGLPTGNYKLIETNVPQPYSMASKIEDRTKYFKVSANSMCETDNKYSKCTGKNITEFTYKNYTTCVTIRKSGNNGDLLPGVVFELYDKSQTNRILLTKTKDGVYTYTTDKNASPIELETNSKGTFTINNLPTGTSTETYYLKETKAPIGYEITEENEWTKISVTMDNKGSCIIKDISNAKGTFNFYKIDEDGNYLSAGIFKLQSYNEDSGKYEDQSLTYDEENDTYSIDEKGDSDIYTFTPNNGIVTFVNVSKTGKYRIVEIEAPEGFVLPNTNDAYVEFVVNASGYVSGDLTMINKKIVTGEGAQAQAELVINIQTGQDRIHYILIISVLAICIIGLIFLSKKINKK